MSETMCLERSMIQCTLKTWSIKVRASERAFNDIWIEITSSLHLKVQSLMTQ